MGKVNLLNAEHILKIRILFFLLLTVALFQTSCNKNSNSLMNRKYQDMIARYNLFYNGTERLKEARISLNKSHVDDFKVVLAPIPEGNDENKKALTGQMDEIIKKASAIIGERPKSKWVDDAFLLLGKAYYFKADYFAAIESFQYLNNKYRNTPIAYEATLWIIRSYTNLGKEEEAEAIIGLLKNDPLFPKTLLGQFNLYAAEVYIKEKKYFAALPHMLKAVEKASAKTKPRYHYIIGQLQTALENKPEARKHFKLVTKGNPPYELAFNAKVNLARSYNPQNKSEVKAARRYLKSMLKDDKNTQYFDEILFELGYLEQNENNPISALDYLKQSLQNNKVNMGLRTKTYLTAADVYFAMPNYLLAQNYYDSAGMLLNPEYENYEQIKKKQEVLTELIQNLLLVNKEDSLYKLSLLSEKELNSLVDEAIKKEKEAAELRKNDGSKNASNPEVGRNPFNQPQDLNTNVSNSGLWYFYDLNVVGRGQSDFRRKYGERPNVDNWKYKSLASNDAFSESQNQGNETDPNEQNSPEKKTDADVKNTNPDREKYTKNIPFSEAAKRESKDRVAEAVIKIGVIYFEDLKNYSESMTYFGRYAEEFKDKDKQALALYYLFKINRESNENAKAEYYKTELISKHPDSDYAFLVQSKQPQIAAESTANEEITELYNRAYNAFLKKDYTGLLAKLDSNYKRFYGSTLQPKFDLIEAIYYIEKDSVSRGVNMLKGISENYPKTFEAKRAEEMVNAFKRVNSVQAANSEKSGVKYLYSPTAIHYAMFVLPEGKQKLHINQLKAKISDFNKQQFASETFSVESALVGNKSVILVKQFNDAKTCLDYVSVVMSNKSFIESLQLPQLQLFGIDVKNYANVIIHNDLGGFMAFYNDYYL